MVNRSFRVVLLVVFVTIANACASTSESGDSDVELLDVWLPWGDAEEGDRLEREFHARVEDLIAQCMEDAGLEYVPVALEAISFGAGTGISHSEHARRFGFGISTNDDQFAAFAASTASVGDPNAKYEESLSTERAIAYSEQRVMCDEQARQLTPALSDQFKRAVDDLVDQVRADPAVVEAEAEWVACVRAGDELLPQFGSLDQLTGWFWQESERVKDRPDELARLQDLEREVAVRHLECEPPLVAVMGEVGERYESDVVADYGDVFERQREFLGS